MTIVGMPVEESMSAKEPDCRPLFAGVLKRIASGEAEGLLCWHLDRLARNPVDGANVIHRLAKQVIKVVVTPDRTYTGTPEDKLLMMVQFGMSTQYSDNLSRNIVRGYQQAIRDGRWPCSRVPIGYLRNPTTLQIVRDRKRWEHVRRLWRLRLAGATTLELITLAQTEMGLRTRPAVGRRRSNRGVRPRWGERLLAASNVMAMFHNPFYAGLMRYRGQLYQGKHEPMVTPSEYWSLQADTKHADTPGTIFIPYRHLLRCGLCGKQYTAERHVKKSGLVFIYYRCTSKPRHRGACPSPFIAKPMVDAVVRQYISGVSLPPAVVALVVKQLTAISDESNVNLRSTEVVADAQRKKLADKDKRLLDAYLNGHVTEAELARERFRIAADQQRLVERPPDETTPDRIELLKNKIMSVNHAVAAFDMGNDETKSALAGDFLSELVVTDGNINEIGHEPFATLRASGNSPVWWSSEDQVRTLARRLIHNFAC